MSLKLWIGLSLIALTASCGTIEGIGRDLQSGSQTIQRAF